MAPLVWRNHWRVAGVREGFEPQWLLAGCRHNQPRGRCRLLRRPMSYACIASRQQILRLL